MKPTTALFLIVFALLIASSIVVTANVLIDSYYTLKLNTAVLDCRVNLKALTFDFAYKMCNV